MGIEVCIQNHHPNSFQIVGDTALAAGDPTGETNALLRSLPAGCSQALVRGD